MKLELYVLVLHCKHLIGVKIYLRSDMNPMGSFRFLKI